MGPQSKQSTRQNLDINPTTESLAEEEGQDQIPRDLNNEQHIGTHLVPATPAVWPLRPTGTKSPWSCRGFSSRHFAASGNETQEPPKNFHGENTFLKKHVFGLMGICVQIGSLPSAKNLWRPSPIHWHFRHCRKNQSVNRQEMVQRDDMDVVSNPVPVMVVGFH